MERRTRRAVGLACLVIISLSVAAPGQQSYRTLQVLRSHGSALKQSGETRDSKPPSVQVHRFLGWNIAQKQGEEDLHQFARARARMPLPIPQGATARDMFSVRSPHSLLAQFGSSGSPGLALRRSLPAGYIPTAVATGDFNGDGFLDWVVSNGGDNNLWIYFGRGDGSSNPSVILPLAGSSPASVVAADLRGIGVLDLVVAESDSGTVGVLLGNGDGTFGAEVQYGPFVQAGQYPPMTPTCLVTGDFNGDGKIDLVVGLWGEPLPGPFAFLPGDGTGHFGAPVYPGVRNVYYFTTQLAAADLNRDGKLDLLVGANADATGVAGWVGVYLGNGDGTFTTQGHQYTPNGFLQLPGFAIGDVNEDGCPDFVTLDTWNHASVFLGNCDGTFQQPSTGFPVGDVGMGAALADVNGDRHLDLITGGVLGSVGGGVATLAGNQLCVLFGDGKGNFSNARVYGGDTSLVSLSVADVNGDGHPDVITANQVSNSVTVFLNDGAGGFGDPQGENFGYGNGQVNAALSNPIPIDVNGDGKADLVLLEAPIYQAQPCAFQIAVMLNDGTGKLSDPIRSGGTDCSLSFHDFLMANFRGTGQPDFLASLYDFSSGAPYLFFAPNLGNGQFGPYTKTTLTGQPQILAAGDFNQDGKLDFVAAGLETNPKLYFYKGNGDGTFTEGQVLTIGSNTDHWPEAIYVGDFNRDGKLDVLVWLYRNVVPLASNALWEFLGNGDGTFAPGKLLFQNFQPFSMADVNHDGWLDIISMLDPGADYPNSTPASFSIYLGQPDGTFFLSGTYAPYNGIFKGVPYGVGPIMGDFNGDGNVDIAAVEWTDSEPFQAYTQFLAGNGDGTFSPTYDIYELSGGSLPGIAADMNGDGKADLIGMAGYSSSVNVDFATAAPALQLNLISNPVIGSSGQASITLDVPSSGGTTIALSASDSAVGVPSSVEVPAGSISQDFQFTLDPSFNPMHVFDISAQAGTDTAITYGSQSTGSSPVGFSVNLEYPYSAVSPGESTVPSDLWVNSVGGYVTDVKLGCQGLPAQAACVFDSDSLSLPEGGSNHTNLAISASSTTPPGSYAVSVVAQDSSFSSSAPLSLQVLGDFSLTLGGSNQTVASTGSASYPLTIAPVQGYIGQLMLDLVNLPSGASGAFSGPPKQSGTSTVMVQITTANAPAGNYTFTVNGTNLAYTHSATGQLLVTGWTSAVSPTSASITAGQSATFTVGGTSVNGDTETLTFACQNPPPGITCSFSPPSVTLPANSTASSQLTIRTSSNILSSHLWTPPCEPLSYRWLLAALLLMIGVLAAELNRRRRTTPSYRPALLQLVLAWLLFLGYLVLGSCGGSTGAPPPSSTSPTPQPQTFNLTVAASSSTQSETAGVIALTVSQ